MARAKVWVVTSREYLERVRTRWFVIATVFFLPIILIYTAWVFRVMRGPVTTDSLGKNPNAY